MRRELNYNYHVPGMAVSSPRRDEKEAQHG